MSESADEFRARREEVLKDLISMYCREHHGCDNLCEECNELMQYALVRIGRCPNNMTKVPCNRCPCPCYSDEMRKRMKVVMDSCASYFRRHPYIRWRFKFA